MVVSARTGCLLAAALLLHGVESRAQSFTNGGFEIVTGPPIGAGDSMTLNVGATWLPGWSAGGPDGSVTVQNGVAGFYEGAGLMGLGPWQGQQWLNFPDDETGGSISQTFATAAGAYCTVSFVAGYVFTADHPLLGVAVQSSNGAVLTNSQYELPYRLWATNQFSFMAVTTNTTLAFSDASTNAEGADIGLDGVQVVAEPPGWPYVLTSPAGLTNAAGTPATFTASAGGLASTIQWYLGASAVPGATQTNLTVIADETNAGIYTAVFSNGLGTNATAPALLTVLQVDSSPVSQTAAAGAGVAFSAAADLSAATVQWFLGPNPIAGATSPFLQVTAGRQTAGNYTARFTLGKVTVATAPALLVVSGIPFVDGSFEQTSPAIPPGTDQIGSPGDEWLTGWGFSGTNDEVIVFNGPFLGLGPATGAQWVVFDSQNAPPAGVVSQTFSTVVGQSYTVAFAAMAIYYEGTPFKALAAAANASDGSLLGGTNVDPGAYWATNQFTFTASTINTTLAFTDASTPALGPSVALDNVSVSANMTGGTGAAYTLTALGLQPVSNIFVMQLAGPPGHAIVETSTDLTAWSPVSTNTLAGSTVDITNSIIPGAPRQFWAAVPAP